MQNKYIFPWEPPTVFLFSAVALLILAYFSVGYYHPDEHFQIMEFAAWKLGMSTSDNLAWEFHHQMRPAIQPAMVLLVHQFFSLFGYENPFVIAFLLRVISAGLSFLAMWMIYRRYSQDIKDGLMQKWFLLLSFLLWFILYNNVRFASENWSGSIFIIGFCYLFAKNKKPLAVDFFITGLLLGLSFIIRFQSGLLIAGLFSWLMLVRKTKLSDLGLMVAGISFSIIVGILIDRWFYGEWVLSPWNYFEQNLLLDKISGFGLEPWYFYFTDIFIRAIPPFSLVFILSTLIVFIFLRKDPLTWILLPFVLFHFMIGHKETRFFYSLIGFLPILVIKAAAYVQDRWVPALTRNKYLLGFAKTFWIVNLVVLFIVVFIPADSQVKLYEKIYDDYSDGITLYYTSDDPYHRAKDICYYKRSNLLIRQADSSIRRGSFTGTKYLVAVRSKDPEMAILKNEKVVYSSYPAWVKSFNFNHWLDRTQFWYVFEISK